MSRRAAATASPGVEPKMAARAEGSSRGGRGAGSLDATATCCGNGRSAVADCAPAAGGRETCGGASYPGRFGRAAARAREMGEVAGRVVSRLSSSCWGKESGGATIELGIGGAGVTNWGERAGLELWLPARAESWLPSAEAVRSSEGGDSKTSDKPGGGGAKGGRAREGAKGGTGVRAPDRLGAAAERERGAAAEAERGGESSAKKFDAIASARSAGKAGPLLNTGGGGKGNERSGGEIQEPSPESCGSPAGT